MASFGSQNFQLPAGSLAGLGNRNTGMAGGFTPDPNGIALGPANGQLAPPELPTAMRQWDPGAIAASPANGQLAPPELPTAMRQWDPGAIAAGPANGQLAPPELPNQQLAPTPGAIALGPANGQIAPPPLPNMGRWSPNTGIAGGFGGAAGSPWQSMLRGIGGNSAMNPQTGQISKVTF